MAWRSMSLRFLMFLFLLSTPSIADAAFTDVDMAGFTSGNKGFRVVGAAAGDQYGRSVSGIGDINGDGIDDVAVGSRFADPLGRTDAGAVTVIYGQSAATVFSEVTSGAVPSGTGFMMHGAVTGDRAGNAVAAAGDVNGDDIDDFIVGANLANPGNVIDAGTAYVLFGRSAGNPFPETLDLASFASGSSTGFKVVGAVLNDNLGSSVNGAGDFNGDGFDDVIIGAPYFDYLNRSASGAAYLLFGHSTATAFQDVAVGSFVTGSAVGFRIYGSAVNDRVGWSVSSAGDHNGDGYDDIIVGTNDADPPGRLDAGISYVMFGHSGAYTDIDLLTFTSGVTGFRILGAVAGDHAGNAVSGAGDINSDGFDDVVVGAIGFDYSGKSASGAAYVIFGRRGSPAFADVDLLTMVYGTLGFRIYGAAISDRLGVSVSGAGDVNGDGIDDLLVGANLADPLGRINSGSAVIVFGHSNQTTFPDINTLHTLGELGYRIYGAAAGDDFGGFVQAAGDVNSDGIDDFIIGAQLVDAGALTDTGAAYIMFGSYAAPTSQPSSQPSAQPNRRPTSHPSNQPSRQPSSEPTAQPSTTPSSQPSSRPSRPSSQPSSQPSSAPSTPTSQPSRQPSSQPSRVPSSQPSTQPNISTDLFARMLSSPTYKVKNGFAFAVLSGDGSVHSWGEAPHGGDASAVQQLLLDNVTRVISSRFAFAAVLSNRSIVAWGIGPYTERFGAISGAEPHSVVATEAAFAGVSRDAAAFAIGSAPNGGVMDSHMVAPLSSGVRSITASAAAFVALKDDGSVHAWGNPHAGAVISTGTASLLQGVKLVVAARAAFAARLPSGAVLAWGSASGGGDSSSVATDISRDVVHVVAADEAFAAFKKDSSLVVWGYGPFGGDASAVATELSANVTFVAHTSFAMAALKTDGSVVSWGKANSGGDSSAVNVLLCDIQFICGNNRAFAALNAGGGVVTWGLAAHGGVIPLNKASALSSGVVSIYHTDRAFAALKSDGSVVVWGQAGHGGSPGAAVEAHLVSGVHTICSNDVAFSVIKTDGSVVGWGHSVSVPMSGVIYQHDSLQEEVKCA